MVAHWADCNANHLECARICTIASSLDKLVPSRSPMSMQQIQHLGSTYHQERPIESEVFVLLWSKWTIDRWMPGQCIDRDTDRRLADQTRNRLAGRYSGRRDHEAYRPSPIQVQLLTILPLWGWVLCIHRTRSWIAWYKHHHRIHKLLFRYWRIQTKQQIKLIKGVYIKKLLSFRS